MSVWACEHIVRSDAGMCRLIVAISAIRALGALGAIGAIGAIRAIGPIRAVCGHV